MSIPKHVAIIMDGNGRWATEKGKKRSAGHKKGAEVLEKLTRHAKNIGVDILSVYAFSTDNFKRSQEEVDYLMDLLIYYFNNKLISIAKEGVKVVISGRKNNLRKDVIEAIEGIENKTKNNKDFILNICLNYGAQEEIIDAIAKVNNDINSNKLNIEDLNRDNFYHYLYQDLPPIDLLIRTGKEHRLSNFMLYQMFYAEIYFVDTYFPDFIETEFDKAIEYFGDRDRRFGSVKKS